VSGQAGAGLALAAIVLFVAAMWWGRGERRARHRLAERMQHRDLRGWLVSYQTLKPRLRAKPDLWLTSSDVLYALGERERAEAELDRLLARWPRFHFARITRLARVRGSDPQAAVPLARELVQLLPDHPSAIASLASVLRSAGQLDEAWQLASCVRRMRPRGGPYHAIAARIATARGDLPAAREALGQAARREPGEARTLVAQADLECAEHSPTAAQAVERARDVVGRTLFSYLESDVAALQARLAAQQSPR
jgi:tetratricopeptide (TPR) repeat protein